MNIACEEHGSVVVLAPEGEITLGNAGEVNDFIQSKLTQRRKLVLDLRKVIYLDSSAVGMIVAIHTTLQGPDGGQLRICHLEPEVFEVFKASSLDSFLNIDLSLDESLSALR